MPRYDWKCSCGATTEVTRSMSQSDVGPRQPCGRCGSSGSFQKTVPRPEVMVPGGRSERSPWPLTVPGLERSYVKDVDGNIVRDPNGRPHTVKRDVTFQSKAEQAEYLDRHGLALMMDGEADSSGQSEESSHSAYHQGDLPAPSTGARKLSEATFFVEDPREVAPHLSLTA